MPAVPPSRVQFVVSGRFFALLLLATGLMGGGYYWYRRQQQAKMLLDQIQERFKTPPYFINRSSTVFRSCKHCLDLDKLKPKTEWNIGFAVEIPATEQRWFLAVEDPPLPVEVAGVLMLPVYPAASDDPTLGFDKNRVVLVLYQSLQRMASVEHTRPPPVQPPPQPDSIPTVPSTPQPEVSGPETTAAQPTLAPAEDAPASPPPSPTALPSLPSVVLTGDHAWRVVLPDNTDWFATGIPLIAEQAVRISSDQVTPATWSRWSALIGTEVPCPLQIGRELRVEILDSDTFITSPQWSAQLYLRKLPPLTGTAVSVQVRTEYLYRPPRLHVYRNDEPRAWDEHWRQHGLMRNYAEKVIAQTFRHSP